MFIVQSELTLNVPCVSESCIEIKIKLNFYFHISCGTSKGFMKAFKAFMKVSSSVIGTGRVKDNSLSLSSETAVGKCFIVTLGIFGKSRKNLAANFYNWVVRLQLTSILKKNATSVVFWEFLEIFTTVF